MAILDEFEVRIKVNDQFAREYDNNEEIEEYQPNTISKYVEVVSGADFSICVRVTNFDLGAGNLVTCKRDLDGEWAGSNHFQRKSDRHPLLTTEYEFNGFYDGSNSDMRYRTYGFANLETSSQAPRAHVNTTKRLTML